MNVVIYARFSSHSQNEQSIEGQLKECYEYAERNGYTIIAEYVDRAISGTTDNRPEFLRMIEDSAKRHFKGVLVYQLDRFARNRYDSATYKAKLKKNGVRVFSARENISDDASGVLMEAVLEGMAEYYSVELAQKIKRGMDINAEKCLSTGGNVALGYCVDKNKNIQINEQTAPIVVKIYEMYASGHSMAEIIRYLNDNGYKTSYGNEFNKNSLHRILTNRRYIGYYTYKGTETKDGIPRIVSDELFKKVARVMEKNRKAPARAKAEIDYILTTKLFCGKCESAMTGISGTGRNDKKYYYYKCVKSRKGECGMRTVQKEYIEDLVTNETKKILTKKNIDLIAREVVALSEKEAKNNSTLQHLKRQLKTTESAMDNLISAVKLGKATDILLDEIESLRLERDELSKRVTLESITTPTLSIPQVKFFMERFISGDANDLTYRKKLIDAFVNKIYLYDDKLTILYNVQDGQSVLSNLDLVENTGIEPVTS